MNQKSISIKLLGGTQEEQDATAAYIMEQILQGFTSSKGNRDGVMYNYQVVNK